MTLALKNNQQLVIAGATGGIASGFYKHASIQQAITEDKVAALINSKKTLLGDLKGLNKVTKSHLSSHMKERGDAHEGDITNVIEHLEHYGIEPVLIDLSNGDLTDTHKYMSKKGFVTVGANKIPLSTSSVDEFNTMSGKNYGAEATVMGGQGIYGDVQNTKNAGIQIKNIAGVFSGTMGFIMSELQKARPLSEIIQEAMDKGYTEPNPMDDLDGLDVAKKLVILAREAGHNVSIDDVVVKGFLGDEYRRFFENGVTDEAKQLFIAEIAKNEDKKFNDRVIQSSDYRKVLRFIANLSVQESGVVLEVGTQEVSQDSQIGGLSGTNNIAVLETEIDTKTLIGPGAGIETTSANVLKNLANILRYQ